jgi:hypothetical protein
MNIDIPNLPMEIKTEELKEVTSSNIFAIHSTEPDPEGLGSYDIFGHPGTRERESTFAYINLQDYFVHPHVFNVLISLKKITRDVIYGDGRFYIKQGSIFKLGEDELPPPGCPSGSGVKWLMSIWDKISFRKEKMSPIVKDRVIMIEKLKKEEIFINRWLVIPPYYRDVDVVKGSKNEINIAYQRLISLASLIKNSGTLLAFQTTTDAHRKIQDTLIEMYKYFLTFVAGTKGFVHLHVMGKATDYSARSVISTPKISADRPQDMEVSYDRSAIPLHMVLKCFAPFIVFGLRQYIFNKTHGAKFLYTNDRDKVERVELADNYTEELLSDNIHKMINLYYDSKESRLAMFSLLCADGSRVPLLYTSTPGSLIDATDEKIASELLNKTVRPLSMVELFYLVAMNTVKDREVYITRYPIEDYHNIFPSFMNIIPYARTKKVMIEGVEYPRFPDIQEKDLKSLDTMFIDTLRMFPTYLGALGADFDGDMCSIQGVFSLSNSAKEYIYSKTNYINIAGDTMRTTGNVTAHTIYALTYKENK